MPGSTGAPTNLPYPVGGDPVQDGDNQVKALADAVAAYFTGGNGAITTTHSMAAQTCKRRAGIVVGNIELTTTSAVAAFATLATVPVGYRPAAQLDIDLHNTATGAYIAALIDPAGLIKPRVAIATATGVAGSFTLVI